MILPQSLMTEWYWTGSIAAFNRICSLRLAKDSQKETKDIAEKIFNIIGDLYPVSWEALENAR
jgi:thymidylate synthase (FAD)